MTAPKRAALLAAAVVLAGCAVESRGSERIAMRAPAWSVAGRPVTLDVTASGAVAELGASIVLVVDGRVVGRESLVAGRARFVVPPTALAPGRHTITIKTGSERAVVEMQVASVVQVALAGAAAGAVLLGLAIALRRRREVSR